MLMVKVVYVYIHVCTCIMRSKDYVVRMNSIAGGIAFKIVTT